VGAAVFRQGRATVGRRRSRVQDADLRVSFLDRAFDVYSDAVSLAVKRGQHDRAFEYADRGRARARADARRELPVAAPTIVKARLAANEAVLYYAWLSDRWVGWLITPGSVAVVE